VNNACQQHTKATGSSLFDKR